MRFLAVLVLALVSISSASAETWQRSIVDLFKETCTVPDTPTAMMAAGDQLASSHSGRLDQARSGRSPFAVWKFTDSSGEPFFINKIWEFSLPQGIEMKAFVSIAGPEYPEMRYSICGFLMPGNVLEAVALEVERLFGYSVVAIGPKSSANRNWRLSPGGAMAEMPCERVIALESYAPQTETTLGFLDLHLPNTGKWAEWAKFRLC